MFAIKNDVVGFAMRFKLILMLFAAFAAQSVCAEDRNYIPGEWKYISSWDIGTSNGQSPNHSTESSALNVAVAAINADPKTCGAVVLTSSSAWGSFINGPGFYTYSSHSHSGVRSTWYTNSSGVKSCRTNTDTSVTVARSRSVSCPTGYTPLNNGTNLCRALWTSPHKTDCPKCDAAYLNQSDKIHGGLGYNAQTETDFSDTDKLSFQRFYISANTRAGSLLGKNWRHSYDRSLTLVTNTAGPLTTVHIDRPDSGKQYFTLTGGLWVSDAGFNERLEHLVGGGWVYTDNSDNKERYSESGILLSIEDKSGRVLTMQYDMEQLIAVVDDKGRSLTFAYQYFASMTDTPKTRLTSVGLPDGKIIKYQYAATGMLDRAIYPDSTPLDTADNPFRRYQYGDGTSMPTYSLTGLFDERGIQYANWQYTNAGKATSSEHGAPSSGIDKVSFVFNADGSSAVTNPYSQSRTYNFDIINGVNKITAMSAACPGCGVNFAARTYDANGKINVETDFAGTTTDSDYNARGLLTQRIESANQAATKRTSQTDWHASFNVPTERRTLNASNVLEAKSTYAYNTRGQATAMCQIDPSNSTAMNYVCGSATNAPVGVRQSTTAYCEQADVTAGTCPLVGLVISSNGPRTDVSDITTFTYYQTDDATCATAPTTCPHRKGDLWKVSNALSQVSEITSYDGAGRALQMKDANNVITDMEYDARGSLTARKIRGANGSSETDDAITRMQYDAAGQVTKVTQADGDFINFVYDAAHRLTSISDAANNSISYTLDDTGNRKVETTKDASDAVKRSLSRVYDNLGRLQASKNAATTTVASLTYDANDNLNTNTDGLNRITDQDVDPLNRLIKTIQDVGGINATTQFEYDARDNLTKVIDPKSLDTVYSYNGLNELTQLVSPDTGTTAYTYDSAGNRATQTDANGNVSNYSYDVLNRVTQVSYTGASGLTSSFVYDTVNNICGGTENFAKGRLTSFTDASGDTQYCYDRFGKLTRKQVTNNGLVSTWLFTYTNAGSISSITYPSGMVVNYAHNTLGETTQVTVTQGSTTTTLVDNVSYLPFGPLKSLSFPVPAGGSAANPLTQSRTYDNDYAIQSVGGLNYGVNVQGNITSIVDVSGGNTYEYDNLDRLSKVKDSTTLADITAFTYDATGNRLSKKVGTAAEVTNTYPGTSHRLTQVGTTTRTLDANGNTTKSASDQYFTYDERNRLVDFRTAAASNTIVSQYQYNAKGERVRKYKDNTDQARYQYNEGGQLLVEEKIIAGVTTTQEIIWLNDMPVGVSQNGVLHGILTDHLNSPRRVFELASQNTVWLWSMADAAFGDNLALEDPDTNDIVFKFDMRFPGQLYDEESGLHYNYFRDYDAANGRYVESDPIGLLGGMSSYSYVGGNVLSNSDIFGLYATCTRFEYNNEAYFHTEKTPTMVGGYSYSGDLPLPQGMPTGVGADPVVRRGRGVLIPSFSFDWKVFRVTHHLEKWQLVGQDMMKRHYLVECTEKIVDCDGARDETTVKHLRLDEKIGSEYIIKEWYKNYVTFDEIGASSAPIPRD